MARIIGFGSQKGGPGKSTLCRGTAVAFAQNDWAVKIADMDIEQTTATDWQKDRLKADQKPEISIEVFGSVSQALKRADAFDMMLFDGSPHASRQTVEIAQASDLFVIPTGLAKDDLRPAVRLADTLHKKHEVPVERIAFALNHVGDSMRELEEAKEYLSYLPFHILDGYLPRKVAFTRAHDLGLSIIETPYPGPKAMAEQLIQSIMNRFNELTN